MSTLKQLGKRIVGAISLLLMVVILNFLLIHLAPGDAVTMIVGEMGGASPELIEELRAHYGLDRSFWEQLAIYISRAAVFDLGYSYYFDAPVTQLILERLPATLLLLVASLFISVTIGVVAGVFSATRPNGILSHLVTVFSLIGFSAPVFWTGLMLVLLFASIFPIFPVAGMTSAAGGKTGLMHIIDILHHLALPAFTLGIVYIAQYSRLARASMLEVLGADYIRTARAKGLSEKFVVFKHALRNALIPIVTIIGLQFAQLFAGAILVETVFSWPGLGRLAYESILRRDYPTILGILLFSALTVMIVNILTDLTYRLVDPRIRAEDS